MSAPSLWLARARGPLLAARGRGLLLRSSAEEQSLGGWRSETAQRRGFAAVPSDFNVLPGDEDAGEGEGASRPAVVQAYDESGFTVGGLDYAGAVICLGKQLALHWADVARPQDITPDRLAVFELIRPRPELLLIGTGQAPAGHAIPRDAREYLRSLGIKVDVQSTRHAAATHNFLSEEGRSIATALLLCNASP